MNDLISNDIVRFFSVIVRGFDECWYRKVSEIGCQYELVECFLERRSLIVDID